MLRLIQYIYATIIASIGGILGGMGTAGSQIIIPGLLVTGITKTYKEAIGTTLFVTLLPLSFGAVYNYWTDGYVQVDTVIILTIIYTMAATFSSIYVIKYFSDKTLYLIYSIYFLFLTIYFFRNYLQS
jgi:uncharacterized membrane protein YfcA